MDGTTKKISSATAKRGTPEENDNHIKVIGMGPSKSGKTCIIKRYCENRFVPKYIPTIGIDYGAKQITLKRSKNEQSSLLKVGVHFWDFSGNPEFLEVRNEFYNNVSAAFLVYDVSNRKSFESIPDWIREARRYGFPPSNDIVLCANKIDKVRAVSEQEGIALAKSYGFNYFDISASSGACVEDMFSTLFNLALSKEN